VSSYYWGLDDVTPAGSSTASGFTTYGPMTVQAAAFAGPLPVCTGTWLAQPQTADVPADRLTTVAANVDGPGQWRSTMMKPGLRVRRRGCRWRR
jgi:hypothetical protein